MKFLVFFVIAAMVVLQSKGKTFSRCELAAQLRSHGFPENKLRDWVCLVEHESSRNTSKIGRVNKNGSRDYGLFQINDKYWCSNTSTKGKDCKVTCAGETPADNMVKILDKTI